MADLQKKVQEIVNELGAHLGINGEAVVELKNDVYQISFDVEEAGLMIGYHGETLDALRLVLSQIIYKKTDEWVKLSVNVGDYQEEREEQLRSMADGVVARVKETKQSESMPFLTARERLVVHQYLAEVEGVKTESVGEDEQRRLVVFPD